jgi:hypothetical protein
MDWSVASLERRLAVGCLAGVTAMLGGVLFEHPASAAVDDGGARESSTPRRLLARINFEENEQFPMELPAGWKRVLASRASEDATHAGVPDLPDFGTVRADRGIGRPSDSNDHRWALQFMVDGASMAIASDPKSLPVEPGAQLLLTAWTRTKDLRHAVIRVALQFADAAGRPLGEPYVGDGIRSEADWRQLRLELPPAPATAAGAIVWLELVQPKSLHVADSTRFVIAENDIRGTALIDDVEVWQLPTVGFESRGDGIVEPGTSATLMVRCSDPKSPQTTVAIRVRDASGAPVYQTQSEIASSKPVEVAMPLLPTGWYEAEARFSAESEEIAYRRARFAVLPRDPFEPDEPPRFGASLGSLEMPLAPAIGLARAAFVVLPVWSATTETRVSRREVDALRAKIATLLDRRIEPMFRISGVPSHIAREYRLDESDTLALFALGEDRWRPALEPWLLAFGQDVNRWLIADAAVEADRPELVDRVRSIAEVLRKSIAGPAVAIPWDPSEVPDAEIAAELRAGRNLLELVADPAWRESAGSLYEGFATGADGMVRIVPLPPGVVDDRERAIDLALRAIDAWRVGFDDVAIDVQSDAMPPIPGPPLELAAWRQVSTRLCGRRLIAEIPIAEGVRALLADGDRGTVLVLWNERGTEIADVSVALGDGALLATDLWGRSTKVEPRANGHQLLVGREPLFVEGVSREMCLFRSAFKADPTFAVARRAAQEGALVLGNPWDVPLSGTLTVLAPDALSMSPKTHTFSIEPHGEARFPVQFGVPRSMHAGPTTVRVAIDAVAREPLRTTLEAALEVGMRGIEVEHAWRLARSIESGSVDLVLTLRVRNTGDQPIDVEAFAVADGYAQNKKPITALPPKATATRVFHFADGARRLSGRDIRAGVHDGDADARLLKRIAVPPLLPPAVVSVPDSATSND